MNSASGEAVRWNDGLAVAPDEATVFGEQKMRIHTDHNGVAVNAISRLADGTDVEGHQYQVLAGPMTLNVNFQNGGVASNGVNGVTNEALLAILIHRTEFLDSKFGCDENKWAIGWMKKALMSLEARTARRITRGVEGKEAV